MSTTIRAGHVGNIVIDGGVESYGQGLPEDACAASRIYPDRTVEHRPLDRRVASTWFEAGVEIAEPEWASGNE